MFTEPNVTNLTDSYKFSQWRQYPKDTAHIYSYFECRPGSQYQRAVFFGLQGLLGSLEGPIFDLDDVFESSKVVEEHMGPGIYPKEAWESMYEKYKGRLPIRVQALPEGSVVPLGVPLFTVENTDPEFFWLPSWLETRLVQTWYPTTVATLSHSVRQRILKGLELTGNPDLIDFKLHDFGFRGASSLESAAIGGAAHLVNFKGSDTFAGILWLQSHYQGGMSGFSIPASEHSTITSWGRGGEIDAFRNMLEEFPTGLVACVSDSYDIDHACSELWGRSLKEEVLSRDGVLVVRPDSGEIVSTVLRVLGLLGDKFGTYTNSKGYLVLNDKVRVIQGDGCTPETIGAVIDAMVSAGWSVDNVAFGMGGGLLQKVDRDTLRCAYKASERTTLDGRVFPVYKSPKGDSGKNSKHGRFHVDKDYNVTPEDDTNVDTNQLKTVFENGYFVDPGWGGMRRSSWGGPQSLEDIRARVLYQT